MHYLPKLTDVLSYTNEAVINRFCFDEHVSYDDAKDIFFDLLGWLWLSVKRYQEHHSTPMIAPLTMLDKMWHVFILHTRAYTDFCICYFQHYLHHDVEPEGVEETLLSTEELQHYLNDCYDFLGKDWVCRNFREVLGTI